MGSALIQETALALRVATDVAAPDGPAPGSPEFDRTATYMARECSEAMADIARAFATLENATKRLDAAFKSPDDHDWSRFGIDLEFRRHRCRDMAELQKLLEREAWSVLVDKLGIKNVMSVKKRKEFDEQLQSGELPPVCENTITAILLGLAGQAQDFAKEAAREVFDILRPRGHWGGQYATNNAFRVGRRVILPHRVERGYAGKYRCNYHYTQEITAIDGIFHLLDGKGLMRENRGPLANAIDACPHEGGRGETVYFRFRCFKNGNLHLEFRNLELVKELNMLAVGERVLGEDIE